MPGDKHTVEQRKETNKTRLIAYLKTDKVDPDMEDLWDRYIWIEDKLRAMSPRNAVAPVMAKYDISRSWAHRLIKETQAFCGVSNRPDKDYLANVHIEGLIMDIKLAREAKQFKVLPSLYKELRLWMNPYDEKGLEATAAGLHQYNLTINLNGESAVVPLPLFYKLKNSEREALEGSVTDDYATWETIQKQINGDDSTES